jgi:hypothetical protein
LHTVAAFLMAQAMAASPLVARHLDLDLSLDNESGSQAGSATYLLDNTGAGAVDGIVLQLGRLMTASGVRDSDGALAFEQDVVVWEGWPTRQVTRVDVAMREPLAPGDRLEVTVDYSGVLVPYTETGMGYVRDRIDRAFTMLRAEAFAFPQVGVPSLEAARARPPADFTYRLRLTLPHGLIPATGNPPRRESAGDGLTTWTFDGGEPVPFLNVAIADYHILERGGFRVYSFVEDSLGGAMVLERARAAADRLAAWLGPLDGETALHIVEIPTGWGSQASLTGGIMQTADAFRTMDSRGQVCHELAHLWHPSDTDPAPPRWSEGWATYLAARLERALDGGASLDAWAGDLAERQAARVEALGDTVGLIDYGERGATDLSYGTGALMFYALDRRMGRDAFDRALGGWMRRYRDGDSTTAQFVAAMGSASPVDLDDLWLTWLHTARWAVRIRSGAALADIIDDPAGR